MGRIATDFTLFNDSRWNKFFFWRNMLTYHDFGFRWRLSEIFQRRLLEKPTNYSLFTSFGTGYTVTPHWSSGLWGEIQFFLGFRMGTAVSGRELCDIDKLLFRVSKSQLKKMGGLGTTKIYRLCYIIYVSLFMKQKLSVCNIPYVLVLSGPANFFTRDFINSEYRTVSVRWLPDPYEIPNIWNLV